MSTKTIRNYSLEFRPSSANFAVESEQSLAQIARDLGAKERALHRWGEEYHQMNQQILNKQAIDIDVELQELRNENARLKQEQNMLKKAAMYFAQATYEVHLDARRKRNDF